MRYQIDVIPCQRKDNGKKLYLQKYTCESSEQDRNILCLHGITLASHVFEIDVKDYSVARQFAKEGYTVWLLDAGGHGHSEEYDCGWECTTENVSIDVVTAMETIVETQSVEKVDLMGWSWGTMTTSTAAGKRPDLVGKLVMIAPVTGGTGLCQTDADFPNDKMTIWYDFAIRLFRHVGVASGAVATKDGDQADELDLTVTEMCVVDRAMHDVFKHALGTDKPMAPNREIYTAGDKWLINADPIKAKTLVIKGSDDIYSTQERVDEILSKLPEGSRCVNYKGAGHGFFFEKDYYQKFRKAVLDFLYE